MKLLSLYFFNSHIENKECSINIVPSSLWAGILEGDLSTALGVSVSTLPRAVSLGKDGGEFMVFLENTSLTACQGQDFGPSGLRVLSRN